MAESKTSKTSSGKKGVKNYVVVRSSVGGTDGKYTSRSGPMAAARKAATKRFSSEHTKLTLTIRETNKDREFTYECERKKLPTPYVATIGGKEIKREYITVVKAVKDKKE